MNNVNIIELKLAPGQAFNYYDSNNICVTIGNTSNVDQYFQYDELNKYYIQVPKSHMKSLIEEMIDE